KTVISTHTITLQEQLIHKDIPRLLDALNLQLKAVLVKGMNNYLCLRKLDDAMTETRLFPTEEGEEIGKIEAWSHSTRDGSRSSLAFAPTPAAWERVGAESDACSHHDCPYYQQCFFFKARKQAQEAQILVVNHHLLFADITKRADTNNYNENSILPPYQRLIIDEAHHMEDIATEYFASRLHRIELLRTLSRLASERQSQTPGKLPILKERLQTTYKRVPTPALAPLLSKLTIELPAFRHTLYEQIHQTFDAYAHFMETVFPTNSEGESLPEMKLRILERHLQAAKWKEDVLPQTDKLIEVLINYSVELCGLEANLKLLEDEKLQESTKSIRFDIQALAAKMEGNIFHLKKFRELPPPSKVRWVESQKLKSLINIQLVDADLDITKSLVDCLFSRFATIILCSATLATNKKFHFLRTRLGLKQENLPTKTIQENIYDSPFDFQKQALLTVPLDMPLPTDPLFNAAAYENIWKAILASRGGAFVLFTSYAMLKDCAHKLEERFKERRLPLLKQGEKSRQRLLEEFKKEERAVLFGTDSFWEGVDVAGDSLRCVIIVKLPFRVPSEPIIQARNEAITAKGGDPFSEYAIPHAVVKFKQGFGRLIRNKWDRGCIVCLDTRLVTKGYGKYFLNSLPPCQKFFNKGAAVYEKMAEFYKQTYYLVKKNPA
ncbi:MAG: ATP-dependent DNA helicase DinG, partial [Parachlamydia sp.]|nr:ATP-dependent DNA helicase DinG [Parachlamydia sp.]